ncbi:MAG: hypothetical protein HC764_07305 [Pleurocapsa sp. CRU_1_2]|nr:hypothetical protein [Pleurocapsa sp. CRU_1_2]
MKEYLRTSEVIDWSHTEIINLAEKIASGHETSTAIALPHSLRIAKACFEFLARHFVRVCPELWSDDGYSQKLITEIEAIAIATPR